MSAITEDAAKAAKRAEIMKKVSMTRKKQKSQELEAEFREAMFGTHGGITCDGCNDIPIVGFRWKCTMCQNHDLCGMCHAKYLEGEVPHVNRRNNVNQKWEDHDFKPYKDQGKDFKGMGGGKQVVKVKKTKPNEPCHCGSGKKYKKCCFKTDSAKN